MPTYNRVKVERNVVRKIIKRQNIISEFEKFIETVASQISGSAGNKKGAFV